MAMRECIAEQIRHHLRQARTIPMPGQIPRRFQRNMSPRMRGQRFIDDIAAQRAEILSVTVLAPPKLLYALLGIAAGLAFALAIRISKRILLR